MLTAFFGGKRKGVLMGTNMLRVASPSCFLTLALVLLLNLLLVAIAAPHLVKGKEAASKDADLDEIAQVLLTFKALDVFLLARVVDNVAIAHLIFVERDVLLGLAAVAEDQGQIKEAAGLAVMVQDIEGTVEAMVGGMLDLVQGDGAVCNGLINTNLLILFGSKARV